MGFPQGWIQLCRTKKVENESNKGRTKMITIVIAVLGAVLLFVLPFWPYSADWGYKPTGGLAFILAFLVVLTLSGRSGSSAPKS